MFARWQEEPQLLPTAQRLHGLTSWQAARSRAETRCPHISCVSVSSRLYLTLGTPRGTGPLFALCLYCTCQNLIVNYHNWRYRETSRWYRGMLILISSRHQRTAVSFTKEQEVTKELSKSMIDWFLEQKWAWAVINYIFANERAKLLFSLSEAATSEPDAHLTTWRYPHLWINSGVWICLKSMFALSMLFFKQYTHQLYNNCCQMCLLGSISLNTCILYSFVKYIIIHFSSLAWMYGMAVAILSLKKIKKLFLTNSWVHKQMNFTLLESLLSPHLPRTEEKLQLRQILGSKAPASPTSQLLKSPSRWIQHLVWKATSQPSQTLR